MKLLLAASSLALALMLALARSCGFTPDELAREGEPCTRTSECELFLECRGGVCMAHEPDAGPRPDASSPVDATTPADASAADASATPIDAASTDASSPDASPAIDGG